MDNTPVPYTVEYYAELNRDEMPQAQALGEEIIKLFKPKSVTDFGCATGLYLIPFKEAGILAGGIDITPEAFHKDVRMIDEDVLHIGDLTKPLEIMKTDVGLCIEVLEHIEWQYADTVVKNLTDFAKVLVVTAAPPGQAGTNHVNCQPMAYWEEKFRSFGYVRNSYDEVALVYAVSKVPHTFWIIRNLMVFKKV